MNERATDPKVAGRVRLAALGLFVVGAVAGGAAIRKSRDGGAPSAAPARPAPRRTASEVIAEFARNPSPGFAFNLPKAEYDRLLDERLTKQCELALELWDEHPGHPRTGDLLYFRWMNLLHYFHEPAKVRDEAARLLAQEPPDAIAALARYVRAESAVEDESVAAADAEADVERAIAGGHEPKVRSGWGEVLLVELAQKRTAAPAEQRRLLERARAVATTPDGKECVEAARRIAELAGQPLAFDFDDALTGESAAPLGASGHPRLVLLVGATYESAEADRRDAASLRDELASLGADFVALDPWAARDALDAERAAWQRFGGGGRLVVDARELERTWAWRRGFRGTPWLLWIGADGRVAAVVARASALRGRLRELAASAR